MMTLKNTIIRMLNQLWNVLGSTARPLFVLIILMQLTHNYRVHAAFDDLGRGARAPGMADTFVGIADDGNASYYNPAGLAQLAEAAIQTEFGSLLRGTDDGSSLATQYLAYAHPFKRPKWGTFGISYHSFKAANLITERTITLSYGWKLNVQPFGWDGSWLAGFNLKQLHHEFQPDRFTENALNDAGAATGVTDPLFANNGFSKDAYAMDIGGLYRFGRGKRFGAGLSVLNLNRPDISLSGDGDKAPLISKLGLSYRPTWGILSAEVRRTRRLASLTDTDISFGGERRFDFSGIGAFILRAGYAKGSRDFKAVTAGGSYLFGNAEIDYAFNFPVGTLSDLQGSHRLGFAYRIGKPKDNIIDQSVTEIESDILASFAHDSLAAQTLLDRIYYARMIKEYDYLLLSQIILRIYPTYDPGLKETKQIVTHLLEKYKSDLLGWPELKSLMVSKVNYDDKLNTEHILELMVKGDVSSALSRMGLLSRDTQNQGRLKALNLMGLADSAAKTYRQKDISSTLVRVNQMRVILPDDKPLEKAYRQLLLMQTQGQKDGAILPVPYQEKPREVELPEAPATLVAPKPVQPKEEEKPAQSELESKLRAYGEAFGYYLSRKNAGATLVEREHLLKQMKEIYGDLGIDMRAIDDELRQVQEGLRTPKVPVIETKPTPAVVPVPVQPAPEPKAEPKPVEKPKPVKKVPIPRSAKEKKAVRKVLETKLKELVERDPEFKESWRYYRRSVDRGITDTERIEILNSILSRFGESGADDVIQELNRIRKRLD